MRRGLAWSLIFIIGAAIVSFGVTLALGATPLLGLDLRGGLSVVLRPEGKVTGSTLTQSVSIIDKRVNGLGVSNSSVTRQGNDIVISLPGVKNAQQAFAQLGQTAQAFFRPVLCQIAPYAGASSSAASPSTTVPSGRSTTPTTSAKAIGPSESYRLDSATLGSASLPAGGSIASQTSPTPPTTSTPATTIVPSQTSGGSPVPVNSPPSIATCSASNSSQIPSTPAANDTSSATVILPYYLNPSQNPRYVLGPSDMSGNGVSTATATVDQTGQYQVQLTFTSKGAQQFDKIAAQRYPFYKQNPSNPPFQSLEAFELDGTVYSAPTIQAQSFNGTAVISGSTSAPFSFKQANDLATSLKYGSLPVRFVPQSLQTVSATIGKDSLHAGIAAGIGGILVVLIYMILYYRLLGLVVVLGLGVGGALLYSIITGLSHSSYHLTLTLAGVVGIIVSVGITVDSYIVYFERLKDEVRAGRSIRQSVDRSFSRAFRTVLTADFVAFLAALILWLLTVGDVRGFAFMLGLSTVLDVFTAYFFIRPMVIIVGRRRAFTEARFLGMAKGLGARTTTREA